MSGVNICVSVGGMRDGKEVAGAGTSCGRILSQTVVQTGVATGSVAAAQLVVKAGQTSPERDVTDEPRLPPPAAEEWGGRASVTLSGNVHATKTTRTHLSYAPTTTHGV